MTSVMKRKIVRPVYLDIVEHISDSIKRGELIPGNQLLSERELCERFQVSRTSVRKALAVLSGMGLVEVTPRDGAYIVESGGKQAIAPLIQMVAKNRHQATHLYEVRRMIEVQAARLAAMRRDNADMAKLWELYRLTEESVHSGKKLHQADMDFHIGIAQCSKNPYFSELMTVLVSSFMDIFDVIWTPKWKNNEEENLFAYFIGQHKLITQAIADQDQEKATYYMTQHIEDSRKRYERVMNEIASSGEA